MGFGFSYPAGALCTFPLTSFYEVSTIKYANVLLCYSGVCMHMVSKINRLVALAVLHAHLSTQLCCD